MLPLGSQRVATTHYLEANSCVEEASIVSKTRLTCLKEASSGSKTQFILFKRSSGLSYTSNSISLISDLHEQLYVVEYV